MTADQLALVPDAPRFTPRQQAAYDLLATRNGATAGEIGAHWHELRGKHAATARCEWCESDGRDVVTSRALRPLVTYKRTADGNLYVLRDATPHEPERRQIDALPGETWEDAFGGAA